MTRKDTGPDERNQGNIGCNSEKQPSERQRWWSVRCDDSSPLGLYPPLGAGRVGGDSIQVILLSIIVRSPMVGGKLIPLARAATPPTLVAQRQIFVPTNPGVIDLYAKQSHRACAMPSIQKEAGKGRIGVTGFSNVETSPIALRFS